MFDLKELLLQDFAARTLLVWHRSRPFSEFEKFLPEPTEPIFLHLMHHYLLEKQKPSLRYSSFELYCPFFPFLEHNVVVHSAEEYYYFQLIFHEDLDSQHLAHIYLESKVNICLSESILVILRWVWARTMRSLWVFSWDIIFFFRLEK